MSLRDEINTANQVIDLLRGALIRLADERAEALKEAFRLVDAGADADETLLRLHQLDDTIRYLLHDLQRARRLREQTVLVIERAGEP